MTVDSDLSIDFKLPKAIGELVEHDYSDFSPADAFRLFEQQNRELWESDIDLDRDPPCEKPFVMTD